MSLFGGLGRGIGKLWQGVLKPVVRGLATQYLGKEGGQLVGGLLGNKADRRMERGDTGEGSMLWNQISPSLGTMYGGGSTAYMEDPGLAQTSQFQNPIQTMRQFGLTSMPQERQYLDEAESYENDEEEGYEDEDYY